MGKIPRYRKNVDFSISIFYSIYNNKYNEFNLNNMDKAPKKLLRQSGIRFASNTIPSALRIPTSPGSRDILFHNSLK